jgi:hypothetical protein
MLSGVVCQSDTVGLVDGVNGTQFYPSVPVITT